MPKTLETTVVTVALAVALVSAGYASAAQASTLYKCTDDSGHTTYATSKAGLRNCTIISEDRSPPAKPRISPASNGTAPDFPKVSKDQQRTRDSDRRYLLEQELQSEQKNLDEAKKSLADMDPAKAPATGFQALRDRVAMHERNLDALRREMSTLR